MGNDLAYVVQAVAPNFVWQTVNFPAATEGMTWSIILSCLLIVWTSVVLYFVKRDQRNPLIVDDTRGVESEDSLDRKEEEYGSSDEKLPERAFV